MTYTVTIHDGLSGDYVLGDAYKNIKTARSAAVKRSVSDFWAFSYTLRCNRTGACETGCTGYEIGYAVRDLRSFCELHPKNRITGGLLHKQGFKLMLDKGYLVLPSDHGAHRSGFYEMTPRGKKLGLYLRKRFKHLKATA